MDFERVEREVFRRYGEGDLEGALSLLAAETPALVEHEVKLAFWRACLKSRLGDPEGALGELEGALGDGHWYGAESLADEDLDAIRADGRFAAVAARCAELEAQHRRERPAPLAVPAAGEERGVLVALHRAAGSPRRSLPHWRPAAGAGWRLLLPAAERSLDAETRLWLQDDRAALDLDAAHRVAAGTAAALAGFDPGRTVLAGFSQGAAVALWWALTGAVPAAALLVVGSSLRYQEAVDAVDAAAATGLRAHFLVGAGELHVEPTVELAGRLQAAGAEVTVDRRHDLGHEFPGGFAAEVGPLLSSLL